MFLSRAAKDDLISTERLQVSDWLPTRMAPVPVLALVNKQQPQKMASKVKTSRCNLQQTFSPDICVDIRTSIRIEEAIGSVAT